MEAKDRLVVALDASDLSLAETFVDMLRPLVGIFKVGSQLYTAHGPYAIEGMLAKGGKVFLDLKYHDIPTTVEQASREAANLGVHMFTVHCLGGIEMMKAARRGVEASPRAVVGLPKVLGVTLLTSHDYASLHRHGLVKGVRDVFDRVNWEPESEAQRRFERYQIRDRVVKLSRDARDAGLDGVVVSTDAIHNVRETCDPKFLIVAVGIRQPGTDPHDHISTMTPREAIEAGADYIVVGRPILKSHDPVGVTQWMVEEIAAAMTERR